MTSKNVRNASLALMTAALLLFAIGCGSETNPEYQEPTGDYHPFGDLWNHGSYLVENDYDFSGCVECHGQVVDGATLLSGQPSGTAGSTVRSCYRCHNGENHRVLFTGRNEHSAAVVAQGWNFDNCMNCHSAAPITEGVHFGGSCSSSACHPGSADGPNACNTCHGDFMADPTDPAGWAPPQGIWATSVLEPGIGAHQAHLDPQSGWFEPMACESCHFVPATVGERAHIDTETPNKAEVVLRGLARRGSGNAQYNPASASCSSVYCHGDATPVWTQLDGTFSSCGSCHGLPPAAPHVQDANCSACHAQVVDASMNIIAPELHLNGRVEVQIP